MARNIDIKKTSENGWNFDRETWNCNDLCVYLDLDGNISTDVDTEDCYYIAEFDLGDYDSDGDIFSCKEDFEEYANRPAITLVQDYDYWDDSDPRLMTNEDIYEELPTREDLINKILEEEIDEEEQEDFLSEIEENGLNSVILDNELHGYALVLTATIGLNDVVYTDKYNVDLCDAINQFDSLRNENDFFSYIIEDDSDIMKAYTRVIDKGEEEDEDEEEDDYYTA